MLRCFPIHHVHGHVGALPWQDSEVGNKRDFGERGRLWYALPAIESIRIIHEDIREEHTELIRGIVQDATMIIFLGFGYHKMNLDRLGIPELNERQDDGNRLWGTAYGLTRNEKNEIVFRSNNQLRFDRLIDCGIVDFFRNTRIFW